MKLEISLAHRVLRLVWGVAYALLYRTTPNFCHGWRRGLLRLFGAHIGRGAHPYPRARIWAPWNLSMGDHSCLANEVDCYCVAPVTLGEHAIVSQYAYLCTASHDYRDPAFPLVARPIRIEPGAWIAAGAFVGPGVTVGEGAVVGARSVLVRDLAPWIVAVGNPCRPIKSREVTRPPGHAGHATAAPYERR